MVEYVSVWTSAGGIAWTLFAIGIGVLSTLRLSRVFSPAKGGHIPQGDEKPEQPASARDTFAEALFATVPIGVIVHNADGVVGHVNAEGLRLLEAASPSEIVGKNVLTVLSSDFEDAYTEMIKAVLAGEPRSMTLELIGYRQRKRWVEVQLVRFQRVSEMPYELMAIVRDIDETHALSMQLVEQRNRLHTIIESEPECVKLQDRDGVIMEMNPAGLAILKADDPHEVIGKTIYHFLQKDYSRAYRELTDDVFAGHRRSLEFEVLTISGERRWLETHAAPLRDPAGKVCALLAITRDIDRRKRDEEKLRRQQDELAHVCRLSTLGELASGLAHELNQPLCALSSYAETASNLSASAGDHTADLDSLLGKIVREAERASGIIDRLREFVRKQAPQPQPNDMGVLIEETLHLINAECKRGYIDVSVQLPAALPKVSIDRVQAEQILLNLFNNAIQASMEVIPERRRIVVAATVDQGRVAVTLRDYADGIPEPLRAQLFTPFFTTKKSGIGMGLSLSRSIAESFGGQLLYEPAHQGSIFTLILPTVDDAE